MCSWCWGFAPQLERVVAELPAGVAVRRVMGGLAPDADEPRTPAARACLQDARRAMAAPPGAPGQDAWRADVRSPAVDARLRAERELAAELGVTGFPTLVLERGGARTAVCRGYAPADEVLAAIARLLAPPA